MRGCGKLEIIKGCSSAVSSDEGRAVSSATGVGVRSSNPSIVCMRRARSGFYTGLVGASCVVAVAACCAECGGISTCSAGVEVCNGAAELMRSRCRRQQEAEYGRAA